MTKPRIKVISEGSGATTKVFTEDGTDISRAIDRIDLIITAAGNNEARIHAILLGGEIDAEIVELQTKVLPPSPPQVTYRLTIDASDPMAHQERSKYRLERHTPLPTYGETVDLLAEGKMAPIGPLDLIFEEEE